MFQNADVAFLKLLALSCKPVFFLRGEYILKKGDLGNAVSKLFCSAFIIQFHRYISSALEKFKYLLGKTKAFILHNYMLEISLVKLVVYLGAVLLPLLSKL